MKILMALMSLGIGGAETHVIELCKKLKSMGHEIFVVSNGGVYVKELEKADLKGIDAILSVVPYYNKPSQEGLYQHFYGVLSRADQ